MMRVVEPLPAEYQTVKALLVVLNELLKEEHFGAAVTVSKKIIEELKPLENKMQILCSNNTSSVGYMTTTPAFCTDLSPITAERPPVPTKLMQKVKRGPKPGSKIIRKKPKPYEESKEDIE